MKLDIHFLPKGLKSSEGWYSRGYLPHFDGGETAQFFTFRLYDSLPSEVIEKLRDETEDGDENAKARFRKRIEKYLDKGHGQCFLSQPLVAKLVTDSLKFHDGKKYRLIAWVIMPNHIHFLVVPVDGTEVRTIAHSIKSYTAHEANKILARAGQFWQHEPFDRYIRSGRHFANVVRYIVYNPVKAGLCDHPSQWRWSSAYEEIAVEDADETMRERE